MNPTDRYLDILGVSRGVTKDDLKTAYRALIQISHPDRFHGNEALKTKAEQQTKLLNEAYKYLSDHLDQAPEPARPTVVPEDRTGAARRREEKNRQDAEYRKRKAQREARDAFDAILRREKNRRDAITFALGVLFAVLLFLYAAYSRRQRFEPQQAEMPEDAAEVDQEE